MSPQARFAMRVPAIVITLIVILSQSAVPYLAHAQDAPPSAPQAPHSSAPGDPSGAQIPAAATQKPDDALDNPVLLRADEENIITYLNSRVIFKYNHDEYDGGASGDRFRLDWLQSFRPARRVHHFTTV